MAPTLHWKDVVDNGYRVVGTQVIHRCVVCGCSVGLGQVNKPKPLHFEPRFFARAVKKGVKGLLGFWVDGVEGTKLEAWGQQATEALVARMYEVIEANGLWPALLARARQGVVMPMQAEYSMPVQAEYSMPMEVVG